MAVTIPNGAIAKIKLSTQLIDCDINCCANRSPNNWRSLYFIASTTDYSYGAGWWTNGARSVNRLFENSSPLSDCAATPREVRNATTATGK